MRVMRATLNLSISETGAGGLIMLRVFEADVCAITAHSIAVILAVYELTNVQMDHMFPELVTA